MAIAVSLHLLSAVVWIGGMLFAYVALRPAAGAVLDPPLRLRLWCRVFDRFFPLVWAAALTLIASGYVMVLRYLGGLGAVSIDIHLMQAVGIFMAALFMYVYFVPYRSLKAAVEAAEWALGARHLDRIRRVVLVNTVLGLGLVVIGAGGRYV